MSSCVIRFVGGPANGRSISLPGYPPEYRILLASNRGELMGPPVSDGAEIPKPNPMKVAVYKRGEPVLSRHVMGDPLRYIYTGERKH